jgi:hypothetical protein
MSRLPLYSIFCAAALMGISCDPPPAPRVQRETTPQPPKAPTSEELIERQKAALERFRTDVGKVDTAFRQCIESKTDPAKFMQAFDTLTPMLQQIEAEYLPLDLKNSVGSLREAVEAVEKSLDALPVPRQLLADAQATENWVREQTNSDPTFPKEFRAQWELAQEGLNTSVRSMERSQTGFANSCKAHGIPFGQPE